MSEAEGFLWESQTTWGFTNSDNSGGGEEKLLGKKLVADSGSNSPTVVEVDPAPSGKRRDLKGVGCEVNEVKGGESEDHEMHIWTERERRKKMRNMFSNLHALLPQLPPKADKSTIVDEAVNYIKTLQLTLQKLQKQKHERLHGATPTNGYGASTMTQPRLAIESRELFLANQISSTNLADNATNSSNSPPISRLPIIFQTWTSSNVILNICGEEAQFSVCSLRKPGLLTTISYVLEKHKIEVLSAHVSSDHNKSMYMIQALASRASQDQFPEPFAVEEVYKQAAGEIMFWISS